MTDKNLSVHNDILEAIESNAMPIPSQPDIVVQLQDVVNDPNVNVNKLCQVIKKDPGLTARILRLANSPLIRGRVPIEGLENAIARMGIAFVGNLAVGLALEQMFQTQNKMIADKMNEVWKHDTYVACICSTLASKRKHIPIDQAMLAGLLHEIGVLSVLSFVEKHPEVVEDEAALVKLIDNHATKLSQEIMTAWQFAPELSNIPVKVHDYYEEKDAPDLADTLLVAKLYALGDKPHPLNELDRKELPCFKRLELDPNKSLDDYPDIKAEIDESMAVFR